MYHDYNFANVLASSARAAWQIEDILPEGAALDFARPFMPENLARAGAIEGLTGDEKRILNQIRGHEYLVIFGLVEEFILPFVLDHARPHLSGDDARVRALLNFAGEEAKHIALFKRFHALFTEGFGTPCDTIGPPEAVAAEVLRHDPLAVALAILMIEWMTQSHYVDSVRDDGDLDPLFKSLLKHHWMEEAQHAKLDTLMAHAVAESMDASERTKGWHDYLAILELLDGGLRQQVELDMQSFRDAGGRLDANTVARWRTTQRRSYREVFITSGLRHPSFQRTVRELVPDADLVAAEAGYAQ